METKDITETNCLIRAVGVNVAKRLGLSELLEDNRAKRGRKPWWQRRLEKDIKVLRSSINIMESKRAGKLKKNSKYKLLEKKHSIKRKGFQVVLEELKQRLVAKSGKVRRYEQRIKQYTQNRLFNSNQKRFFQQLDGGCEKELIVPDAERSVSFWKGIWGREKEFNKNATWLREIEENGIPTVQDNLSIGLERVLKQCKKMPSWKTPGPDGVQGFWIKNVTALHKSIASQFDKLLNGDAQLPQWLTCGKTVLCLKDPAKGNAVENFRPITCLPMMWKLFTGVIAESVYEHLDSNELLPVEQKGCRRRTRGTKDQLLIDKMVLRDSKKRHTNLSMAWIDYKKAFDMVPHSWILKCMRLFGCADNVVKFIADSMKGWMCTLVCNEKVLGNVLIKRGIFQGDSLSPLLFVLCMIPLSFVLRKVTAGYEVKNKKVKINHLLFMDDVKLYGKNERQLESLVNTVQVVSEDIGMEFGIGKCGVLSLKRGKVIESEGIVMPNGEVMRSMEETGYKYLGVLEMDQILEKQMKDKEIEIGFEDKVEW